MEISLPNGVRRVFEVFRKNGYECYIVGGCVRDFLMGVSPHDFDCATNALPEEILHCFLDFRTIETGIKHGTVTVVSDGMNIEITTYRRDGEYKDCRRPESVSFSASIAEDLARRDFTINAMAYNPEKGLVDLYGGAEAISSSCVACVGTPDRRLTEDALRILRGLRFAATLGFELEAETAVCMHKHRELLRKISAERIYSEFSKLLLGDNVCGVLTEYRDIVEVFIPELIGTEESVYNYAARAVSSAPEELSVRAAAFLAPVRENAAEALKRLTADRRTVSAVSALLSAYGVKIPDSRIGLRRLSHELGRETLRRLIELYAAEGRGEELLPKNAAELLCSVESDCTAVSELKINGRDLLDIGVKSGRTVGVLLERLLLEVMEEKTENSREALLKRAGQLMNN